MNKKEIIEGFDDLARAKKNSAIAVKLSYAFCLAVVIASLYFQHKTSVEAENKIRLITKSGQYVSSSLTDKTRIFNVLLTGHCADAIEFLNSFDRATIKTNQVKAQLLVNPADANRVFAAYQANRAYGDVIDRGVIYKTEFVRIDSITTVNEPYHVICTSRLRVTDGETEGGKKIISSFLIKSEGDIISVTPQYPDNEHGFWFSRYVQSISPENQAGK